MVPFGQRTKLGCLAGAERCYRPLDPSPTLPKIVTGCARIVHENCWRRSSRRAQTVLAGAQRHLHDADRDRNSSTRFSFRTFGNFFLTSCAHARKRNDSEFGASETCCSEGRRVHGAIARGHFRETRFTERGLRKMFEARAAAKATALFVSAKCLAPVFQAGSFRLTATGCPLQIRALQGRL
jgi:hypothetical protein